jgi:hypothetical protein
MKVNDQRFRLQVSQTENCEKSNFGAHIYLKVPYHWNREGRKEYICNNVDHWHLVSMVIRY